jgi:hypothetical protein
MHHYDPAALRGLANARETEQAGDVVMEPKRRVRSWPTAGGEQDIRPRVDAYRRR